MKAIVPFKVTNAKSRLSSLFTAEERSRLARLMLRDITDTLKSSGVKVALLTTMPFDWDAEIIVSEKDLNAALNEFLEGQDEPVMIVMADVPLISRKNVKDMMGSDADIVISPGRGGGTNVQFIKDPKNYHVDYYGASFLDHMEIARKKGLKVEVFDSFRTSSDIDETGDLVELYIHGDGEAAKYLRSITKLDTSKGRVKVVKEEREVQPSQAPVKRFVATE
jgi:2-phospho-L-lactate guanylyltransferase